MDFNERLENMQREAEQRRQETNQDLDELAGREFAGESEDDCVWVTVDGRGSALRVKIDPQRLKNMRGDELGRKVVEAVQAARSASREGTSDVRERLPGDDSDAMQQIRDTLGHDRR